MFTGVNPLVHSLMLSILVSSFSNGLMNSKLYFGYRLEILTALSIVVMNSQANLLRYIYVQRLFDYGTDIYLLSFVKSKR
jgi:hypothetical protein